jgi:hypothetical protein
MSKPKDISTIIESIINSDSLISLDRNDFGNIDAIIDYRKFEVYDETNAFKP